MSAPMDFLGLGLGRGGNDPAGGFGAGRDSDCGNVDIEAMATLYLLMRGV